MILLHSALSTLLNVLELLFFARAILSWFVSSSDSDLLGTVYEVTYNLTEPLIMPVRMLLDRFSIGRGLPIDLAFLVTLMLITALGVAF